MEVWVLRSLNALYRQRWLILALTLFTMVMGLVRGTFSQKYEAQSMLLLTPLGATSEGTKMLATGYPAKVYTTLLKSPQVAAKTIGKLVETRVIAEDNRPRITDFIATLDVDVETVDATTRPVTYSPLITLRAQASNRDYAVAVAKAWTDVAIEHVNEMLVLPYAAGSNNFAEQADASKEKLEAVWKELSEEKSKFDLELMREQAKLKLVQLDLMQTELNTAKATLEGLQKSLLALREVLAVEKPVVELAKAPTDEAFWIAQTESGSNNALKELSGKVMVTQEVNVAYWNLKELEGQTMSDIAANEGKVASLTALIEQMQAESAALQAAIGEHTVIQRDLETREAVVKLVYDDIAKAAALNAVTLGILHTEGEGLQPIGLNPLIDEIQATRVTTLLGGRRAAFSGAVLGFLLICSIIIVRDVAFPWLREVVRKHGESV